MGHCFSGGESGGNGGSSPATTTNTNAKPTTTKAPELKKQTLRVLLVGNIAIGKTSFIRRYVKNDFKTGGDDADILQDTPTRTLNVGDYAFNLTFMDTQGNEKFNTITVSFYDHAHIIILCYDITDQETWDDMTQKWAKEVKKYNPSAVSAIVGMKTDQAASRTIKYTDAEQYASSLTKPYFECSSRDGSGLDPVLQSLAEEVTKRVAAGTLDLE